MQCRARCRRAISSPGHLWLSCHRQALHQDGAPESVVEPRHWRDPARSLLIGAAKPGLYHRRRLPPLDGPLA
eukprot:SAG22_NODE_18684_length_283_cov_0.559783_1_plen_71_part_01